MAQVASIDWATKRVYLHLDTVSSGFDVIAAHFEINAIIAANSNQEQNYKAVMEALGNDVKSAALGTFTPRYGRINPVWRFVPYDTPHLLQLLVEIVSLDGIVDTEVFDRTLTASEIDIDPIYDKVEIREKVISGAVTAQDLSNIAQAVTASVMNYNEDA
jgi:hypothetical protein